MKKALITGITGQDGSFLKGIQGDCLNPIFHDNTGYAGKFSSVVSDHS